MGTRTFPANVYRFLFDISSWALPVLFHTNCLPQTCLLYCIGRSSPAQYSTVYILPNNLTAFLQPYTYALPVYQAACYSSVIVLTRHYTKQSASLPLQPYPCPASLPICLPFFYESSALAVFYQTISMPPSSPVHTLPIRMLAIFFSDSSASTLFYRTIQMPQTPACSSACHFSMTAHASVFQNICLPQTLPAVVLAVHLRQLFPEATPNYLPASHPACSSDCNLLWQLFPRHYCFIWY